MQRLFLSLKNGGYPNLRNSNSSNYSSIKQICSSRIFSTLTNPCRHNFTTPTTTTPNYQNVAFFSKFSCTHFTKTLMDRKVGFFTVRFSKGFTSNSAYNAPTLRSWFNKLSANNILFGLIVANSAVFMAWQCVDKKFMSQHFMISLDNFKSGRVHTMLTSAFSHIDAGHLVYNMLALYFFGRSIARTFGTEFLLKLYVAGALGGSVFYLVHHAYMALSTKGNGMQTKDPSRIPALGASGAVNAIMLLYIFLNPRATIYLEFVIPVPAILLGIFLIGKDALRIIQGDSTISGSTHLGGLAVAAIAYARVRKGRF
ncbi:RHOMBOID-like protein 12 [Euphorbia peplus]|nr:RHOMBOID-like protein 12 [Euphorbia peplus]